MKKKLIFILTIFLLILQVEVQSIGIGTLVKNSQVQVMRGDTARFTILLWDPENYSFPIKFKTIQVPEGLSVIIDPKELMMNFSRVDGYSTERGMEYMNAPYGLMKTIPINVLVKVSNSVNLGDYDVYVNLAAGEPTNGISTIFEKTFKFNVKVVYYINKQNTTQNIDGKLIPDITDTIKEKITGMFSKTSIDSRVIFIVSLMIGIFLVIWTIYKHE